MPTERHTMTSTTTKLLRCGIYAGVIYVSIGLLQILLREGFDITRHPLSILANGRWGWVQVGNFLVTGLLMLAFAVGVYRALKGCFGGTFGALMLGLYGVGIIGAGIFVAGPMADFPPADDRTHGFFPVNGMLHFMAGGVGFLCLILAAITFGLRFARAKEWRRSLVSILTAILFTYAFMSIASGPPKPATMLTFFLAVLFSWLWIIALTAWLKADHLAGTNPEERTSN